MWCMQSVFWGVTKSGEVRAEQRWGKGCGRRKKRGEIGKRMGGGGKDRGHLCLPFSTAD